MTKQELELVEDAKKWSRQAPSNWQAEGLRIIILMLIALMARR